MNAPVLAEAEVAQRRAVKAHTLALFAWRHGLTGQDLFALTEKQRQAMARAASVNPPSHGSPTWGMVFARLQGMAEHADDPRAPARDLVGEGHWWKVPEPVAWPDAAPIPAPANDREPADPLHSAPQIDREPPVGAPSELVAAALASWDPAPPPDALTPDEPERSDLGELPTTQSVPPVLVTPPTPSVELELEPPAAPPPPVEYRAPDPIPADAPPGWDQLVAASCADPLPAACRACTAQAIVNTPDGFACQAHPPTWGRSLNWAPNPARSCPPARCYCGRCDSYRRMPTLVPSIEPEWRYTK